MGLIKEPREIDFTVQSEPWTEEELIDFRKLMNELKSKNSTKTIQLKSRKTSDKKYDLV